MMHLKWTLARAHNSACPSLGFSRRAAAIPTLPIALSWLTPRAPHPPSRPLQVQWQLQSNRNNFLPRLGGALTQISINPGDLAQICVVQADNTVRVIDTASFKVLTPPQENLLPPACPPA